MRPDLRVEVHTKRTTSPSRRSKMNREDHKDLEGRPEQFFFAVFAVQFSRRLSNRTTHASLREAS